jgi:hypothetical protein
MAALLILALAVLLAGCGSSSQGVFKAVIFEAPSLPDRQLRPLLEGVDSIGVLASTNIEPFRELDIEKVMGRLADATVSSLKKLPDKEVVSQDEIRWHFRELVIDSTLVDSTALHDTLRQNMGLGALVYIELISLKTQMTPMSPGPYGGVTSNPGLDLSVNLKLTLINTASGETWSRQGERRNWKPVKLQVIGGGDQTERQLLAALAGPMRQFLGHLAPLPSRQERQFELSGD